MNKVLWARYGLALWMAQAAWPVAVVRSQEASPALPPSPTLPAPPQPTPVIPKLEPKPFSWTSLTFDLPESVKVFAGEAVNVDNQPVKAWYAEIDYSDQSLLAQSLLPTSGSGRERVSVQAQKAGALLAVNSGYFDMRGIPATTFSTVINNGQLLAKNTPTVMRGGKKLPLMRGAFGIRTNRSFDISWIAHLENEIFAYPTPLPPSVTPLAPSKEFPAGGALWTNIVMATGGGPVLLKKGEVVDSAAAEFIGPEMSLKRHPRTAVGFTANNRLIFFVTDGRQPLHSMGMTLPELAQAMKDLGCVEALNLDGGGSTTFWVKGAVLNKPSDGRERNVTSVLALVPNPELRAITK
jgi:hypothetical protein